MAVMMAEDAPGPQAMRPMQKQLVIGFSDIIYQNTYIWYFYFEFSKIFLA